MSSSANISIAEVGLRSPGKDATPEVRSAASGRPYEWILHPVLDLLFCCGGIVWILFALHYCAFGPDSTAKPVQIMVALAALGTIGLGETHIVATLQRIY